MMLDGCPIREHGLCIICAISSVLEILLLGVERVAWIDRGLVIGLSSGWVLWPELGVALVHVFQLPMITRRVLYVVILMLMMDLARSTLTCFASTRIQPLVRIFAYGTCSLLWCSCGVVFASDSPPWAAFTSMLLLWTTLCINHPIVLWI